MNGFLKKSAQAADPPAAPKTATKAKKDFFSRESGYKTDWQVWQKHVLTAPLTNIYLHEFTYIYIYVYMYV